MEDSSNISHTDIPSIYLKPKPQQVPEVAIIPSDQFLEFQLQGDQLRAQCTFMIINSSSTRKVAFKIKAQNESSYQVTPSRDIIDKNSKKEILAQFTNPQGKNLQNIMQLNDKFQILAVCVNDEITREEIKNVNFNRSVQETYTKILQLKFKAPTDLDPGNSLNSPRRWSATDRENSNIENRIEQLKREKQYLEKKLLYQNEQMKKLQQHNDTHSFTLIQLITVALISIIVGLWISI